jgi:hypothetical protein
VANESNPVVNKSKPVANKGGDKGVSFDLRLLAANFPINREASISIKGYIIFKVR